MTAPLRRLLASFACVVALCAAAIVPARGQEAAAPSERDVVAEGRAAVDPAHGGLAGAKESARKAALRAAVEKALGVYVSAQTLTRNYQLVSDRIVARSDGFAVPLEVLSEAVSGGEVRVVLRARVSVRPLAEQIRALGLARVWRVRVSAPAELSGTVTASGAAALERALSAAGFTVVRDTAPCDIVVSLAPRLTTVAARDLETAAGPLTLYTIRADVVLRATREGAATVVAALSSVQTALHIRSEAAQASAVKSACDALAQPLADALLVLPAAQSHPVMVTVSGLADIGQVEALERSLEALPGVDRLSRRGWESGRAEWDLEVFADAGPSLPRDLEKVASLPSRRLRVVAASRARIDLRLETATAARPPKSVRKPPR